ncbi:MAG: hypothetical protein NC039_05400 [Muribaculaceae bacterium]|nr:hypothetical protein [Muribaculaceae bacterium]
MHKFAIHMIVALTALLIAACSEKETDVPGGTSTEPYYRAGFTIVLADNEGSSRSLQSRAPATGEYEPGTADENYIDINGGDFLVLVFDKDDNYIATLEDIELVPEDYGTLKRYRVSGKILAAPLDAVQKTFKVMMLANWQGNYPTPEAGTTKLADIAEGSSFLFDYEADQDIVSKPIPMFGVTNVLSGLTFFEGFNTDLGQLQMLRAYAKIRLRLVESDFKAESVTLTLGNPSGFRAPMGVSRQDQYVHGSYDKDYYRIPTVPPASSTVFKKQIPFKQGSDGVWTLYLPEFQNLRDGQPLSEGDRARIRIQFQGGEPDGYVDFKYYNEPPSYAGADVKQGDHFDILRNTVYDFTVSKGAVIVDVQPYSLVELRPDFGLERDDDGNIIVRDENGDILKIIDVTGNELHFSEFDMYDLSGTGVYDENDNVQMVYLDDGRMMVFNYQTGTFKKDQDPKGETEEKTKPTLIRWEIYSYESMEKAKNLVRTMFLMEEYEEYRYDWSDGKFWPVNLHNVYDDGATVIQRHTYASKADYDAGKKPLTTSIDFRCTNPTYPSSYRYGDKIVRYYNRGEMIRQTRITKKYEQGTNDYNDDAYEVDYYEMDDEGNYLLDDQGRRKPVYKTDENGNFIPVMVNKYYFEDLDLNAELNDNEKFNDWPY